VFFSSFDSLAFHFLVVLIWLEGNANDTNDGDKSLNELGTSLMNRTNPVDIASILHPP
jgi:hypothetical protein